MDPITLVSGAMALSDAVGLTSWIGQKLGGDVGEKTANKITDIAQAVTGGKTPEEALEIVKQNNEMAQQVRMAIIDNEHELTKVYLEDVKSARAMYSNTDHKMADDIASKIIKYNVWFIIILLLANVAVPLYIPDTGTVALISSLIGASVSYLWNERAVVIAFFFGSSKSSKDKTDKMTDSLRDLSKK